MLVDKSKKDELPIIGIYKLTSPNNKIYIGKSTNIKNRMKTYSKVRSHNHKQKRLYASINKYGWLNFKVEVIEETLIDSLDEREIYWIDFYKSNYNKYPHNNGLNLTDGGIGTKGNRFDTESIKKLKSAVRSLPLNIYVNLETGIYYNNAKEAAEAHGYTPAQINRWSKGIYNPKKPIFRISVAEEVNVKYLNGEFKKPRLTNNLPSRKGKKLTEEQKIERKNRKAGKWYPPHKPSPPQTEEHKAKTRAALIGRVVRESTRHKTRMSNPKILILLDVNTGIYYESLYEACETFSINKGTLYDQLIKRTKKQSTNLIIT